MNVTIRVVHADTVSALPYAKQDMFAYGLYFNRELNDRQSKILEETTIDRIDLTVGLRGTFYLPDQRYDSGTQLRRAYPGVDALFCGEEEI